MFGSKKKVVQENGDAVGTTTNLDPALTQTIQTIRTIPAQPGVKQRPSVRSVLLMMMIITSTVILLLPYECGETIMPDFMTVANYQKIMAAYVMGIVTMGVLMGRN